MFTGSNVTIMVADMERAIDFYTRKLGMTLEYHVGNKWAQIQGPGITLGLHAAKDQPEASPALANVSIGLMVDDLEASMKELQGKDVEFEPEISDDGPIKFVCFQDPDGTALYLCQFTGR